MSDLFKYLRVVAERVRCNILLNNSSGHSGGSSFDLVFMLTPDLFKLHL